jgi:mannose-6-phosphate isomerase-like protein (cupin superfamily)
MRKAAIALFCLIAIIGTWKGVARGQGAPAAGAAPAPPPAPTDKAAYWNNTDIQAIWKNLEARQVINQRVMEGGSFSLNIRIVKEGDAPLVHATSCDLWIVQAGTATAVTGGTLANGKKRPNVDDEAGTAINGGIEQPLKAGDILYVPPGVPHGFKDIKGFRAFLVRWDVKKETASNSTSN